MCETLFQSRYPADWLHYNDLQTQRDIGGCATAMWYTGVLLMTGKLTPLDVQNWIRQRRTWWFSSYYYHHHHGEDGSRPERPLYPRNRRKITTIGWYIGSFLPCDALRCTVFGIVILSVCLSVCHTRGLCPHGLTYDRDFFTIWWPHYSSFWGYHVHPKIRRGSPSGGNSVFCETW